jgi:polygalacturonase
MQQDRRNVIAGAGMLGLGLPLGSIRPAGAAAPAAPIPAPGGVNVRDFGAVGDGSTIDTPAIDRAIDAVAKRGGGTVYVPAGTYACYTIHLQSRVTIYLDQGAVIVAASVPKEGTASGGYDKAEPQDPAIERFQDFGHNHWRNSLFHGEGLHDIAITGPGLIWGRGLSGGHDDDPNLARAEAPGAGNKTIALKNCRNVQLRDFKLLHCGHFALLATGVDNLVIDNLIVDTNRDGFDIDCCRNVRVTNCTVNSPYDDGICPKSSMALGYARATENVTISGCYVTAAYRNGSVLDGTWDRLERGTIPATGRIKCGTESNGGFKNIAITNCVFDSCKGIALESVDGANLEDIAISNITMRGLVTGPLFLRLGRRMRGPKGVAIGTLKRVMIQNITSSGAARLPSIIAGVAGNPVEDIHVSDVYFEQAGGADPAMAAIQPPAYEDLYPEPSMFGFLPACGFFVRHARNVVMHNVEIATLAPDARPAFWLQDVEGFDCSALRAPGGVTYALDRVAAFRNAGSLTAPDRAYVKPVSLSF